jgi:hypothetical protein
VHEAALALPAGRKGTQVKEYEIAEAMEDLCLELEAYGLALEYNVPTTRYSNNKRNGRHKGSWIEKYAVNKCGDICKMPICTARAASLALPCALAMLADGWPCCTVPAVNEYEDELVSLLLPLLPADTTHSMSYEKHAEAVEVFCQATIGICEEGDRDVLGDWEGDGITKMQTKKDPNTMREPLQEEVGDPLLDKHAEIPEGKTLDDLLPDGMPVFTADDFAEEPGGDPVGEGKKSKQKGKNKKQRKQSKSKVKPKQSKAKAK